MHCFKGSEVNIAPNHPGSLKMLVFNVNVKSGNFEPTTEHRTISSTQKESASGLTSTCAVGVIDSCI